MTVAALAVMSAAADEYEYPYLVFTLADGTKTTVAAEQLELTVSDGKLVAANASVTKTLDLEALASMTFSKENVGDDADGINLLPTDAVPAAGRQAQSRWYDLSGRQTTYTRRGVYVVRSADGKTRKVLVR